MNWGGVAIIVGAVALALHFTAPPPAPTGPTVAAGQNYVYSPSVLGVGRYPPTPTTVTDRILTAQQVLAFQDNPNAAQVDIGGYTYQTMPTI